MLDRIFHLDELKTDVRTEIGAGIVTFLSMSYIIFVNPAILADAGIPKTAAFGATIIATALTTYMMAFYANMPLGLAPGMGINAYFAYTVVLQLGLPWQTALGATFISGVTFFLLSVSGLRQAVIDAIPINLKLAISAGIGLFIAMIGLQGGGIVVDNPATLVTLGDLTKPKAMLTLFGMIVTAAMMARGIKGAMLYGIFVTTLVGIIFGQGPVPHSVGDVLSLDLPDLSPTFLQLDVLAALKYGLLSVLFTMTIIDMFDSIGSIIGMSIKAGRMDSNGNIQGIERTLITDSCGTMLAGVMGTPSVVTYVESCTGIASGGRSGLTAATVATLFLACLILSPLVGIVQPYATAPVLIIIGVMMAKEILRIDFEDMTNALPAFLTVVTMPMTYNIGTGFGLGFISYVLLKTLTGRFRELNVIMIVIAVCFGVNFVVR